MPTSSLACPFCASTRLTPATELGNISTIALYFYRKNEPKTWLGRIPEEAMLDRGRICLECGFVSLFCSPESLKKLRSMEKDLEGKGV